MNKQNKNREKWKDIKISRELRDIIHGYIMSDGYVRVEGSMQVEQSLAQEKFVEWLYEQLKIIRTDSEISLVTRTDKRNNRVTQSKRFFTRNLLTGFHRMWYESSPPGEEGDIRYKKRLPKNLKSFFNATFITVWFAGDGTKMIGQRGAKFEVTAFTAEERLKLKKLFKEKFGINAVINRAGQSTTGNPQWSLSINSPDYDKFRTLITQIDLIPTIFPYKLHTAKA
jgi:hypothetical protein